MFVPNHQHLIIKGNFTAPPKEIAVINQWFIELVKRVNMVVVAGPTSVYVTEEGNEGLTGTVTLATSHSSIHIWDNSIPSLFQFDIYTCGNLTKKEAKLILENLSVYIPTRIDIDILDRKKKLNLKYHQHWNDNGKLSFNDWIKLKF